MAKKKRIVLGVTGSIAAYKSADLIRRFIEKGLRVSVVMTKEAENFITPLTLSSLADEKVYTSMFDPSSVNGEMPHIDLAENADALLIAPATANIIGKLANGLADDLLTCIAMATKAPIIVAPAMNTNMFENKAVKKNIKTLESMGVHFIAPVKGKLACGTTGYGHIADEDTIYKSVLKYCR